MLNPRKTGQTKITSLSAAAVLFGDDVVDLEGEAVVFLGDLAVFAPVIGPSPQFFQEGAFHA